jgi:RecB family endonuclease NucS
VFSFRSCHGVATLYHRLEPCITWKAVEDYLENHLEVIGSKIDAKLKLVGRQYSTTVGPIDLLAVDTKNGDSVVIELKKGRSADKVYG